MFGCDYDARIREDDMTVRAALYLRVSTKRQAEKDLSIPDQRRQIREYCEQEGMEVVAEYAEPDASATDDKRPEFQWMIDDACRLEHLFDVVIVHSFSRFFRDVYGSAYYLQKLEKQSVSLISITQQVTDDPAGQMVRTIFAAFDQYSSQENAKHVARAMIENARQGFWNGSRPPAPTKCAKAGPFARAREFAWIGSMS